MKKLVLCSLAALMMPSFALAKTDTYSCQLTSKTSAYNDYLNLASGALTCNITGSGPAVAAISPVAGLAVGAADAAAVAGTCGKNYYAMVKGAHKTGKGTTYTGLDVYKCVVTVFDDYWAANLEKEIVECGAAQKCSWNEFGEKGGYVYRTNKLIQRAGSSYYATGTIENFCKHKKEQTKQSEMKQTCSLEYSQKCVYNNKKYDAGSTIDNCGGGLVSKKQHCVSLLHSCNGATGLWDVLSTTLRCEDGWKSNGGTTWDKLECIKSSDKSCKYGTQTYKNGGMMNTCDGGLDGRIDHCKDLMYKCDNGRFVAMTETLICEKGWVSNEAKDRRDLKCVKD